MSNEAQGLVRNLPMRELIAAGWIGTQRRIDRPASTRLNLQKIAAGATRNPVSS